jgi:DNA-directed RNA polymerase sigma subunit (sigma70/sigma32)
MRANQTLAYFTAHISKLPHLSSREKEVLVGRIESSTLEVIGSRFELTEGRIRQIERGALKKVASKFVQQELLSKE